MYNFCRKFNKLVILIMEMLLACGFLLLLLIHPLPIYAQTLLIFFPAQVTLRNTQLRQLRSPGRRASF
jgi:hypothetical protein